MHRKITKVSFEGQRIYAGIDVHKKNWTVSIMGEQYEHKTFSQNPIPGLLTNYLQKNFPGADYHAVYEAGFSGFSSCRELKKSGINCIVIHPADVPTTLKEQQQKNDKVDSRKLAKSLRSGNLEAIDVPDPIIEADRALVRQRYRAMKDVSRTKNRVKSLLCQFGIIIPESFSSSQTRHWSKCYINWLRSLEIEQQSLKQTLDNYLDIGERQRKELLALNKQVRDLTQTNRYKGNYQLLLSVPGIGLMTAITILTQIGNIKRFKRLDDLCNYVGLVPSMHSSGEKTQTGKLIKRGRKELKIMLIEAAWQAIQKDPALMHKFNELAQRMHKNKAIIRIARKVLSRIRFVLQNQQEYCLGIAQ